MNIFNMDCLISTQYTCVYICTMRLVPITVKSSADNLNEVTTMCLVLGSTAAYKKLFYYQAAVTVASY